MENTKMIEVGKEEKKEVTKRNHEIYKKILEIMEEYSSNFHMGKEGLSKVADFIEENFKEKS